MNVEIAVIGGTGLSELAPVVEQRDGIAVCRVGERCVAFLNRHGPGHRLPPHAIDYRANLAALAGIGVGTILSTFACGSLVPQHGPGTLVVPDQLIDRTRGRKDTFHDTFEAGPAHASFAEPYDDHARSTLLAAAPGAVDGGTVVLIDGPRFATRAESRSYRALGGTLVNMTQYPESVLARELGIAYAAIGLVTDYDAGVDDRPEIEAVTQESALAELARHLPALRAAVLRAATLV